MSQHPSLRSKSKEAIHRSVLKRYERLKALKEKEKWDEEESVYGLPKLKIVKFKVKKEKTAEVAEGTEEAVGTAADAKPAEGAKGAAGKDAAGKKDATKADGKAKADGKSKESKK